MTTQIRSQDELLDIYVNEVKSEAPELTDFSEGSMNDTIAGATVTAIHEAMKLLLDEFAKTYFSTANGPEVTGDSDDLETLAVDHFGDDFSRPEADKARGIVTFSRATSGAGDCVIPIGTVVKTELDANGESIRFQTLAAVTMSTLTINASVEAFIAGTTGNVGVGDVTVIESTLTDPTITVDNSAVFGGGSEDMEDAEYREYIKNKIVQLRGATKEAIETAAEAVDGVEAAVAIETETAVIEYDIATGLPLVGAEFFRIPYVRLYVADANGEAEAALIVLVRSAVDEIRAFGVKIEIIGAEAVSQNWTATYTLNPSGPNFTELSSDPTLVTDSMAEYIRTTLSIGDDFVRADADAAILAIWGPAGTDDLTAFSTTTPVGDVTVAANQKLIPGTMTIA
jgi:hypothetical protein